MREGKNAMREYYISSYYILHLVTYYLLHLASVTHLQLAVKLSILPRRRLVN